MREISAHPLHTPDRFLIPAYRKSLSQNNPKHLEHHLALEWSFLPENVMWAVIPARVLRAWKKCPKIPAGEEAPRIVNSLCQIY